jgi:hypothetical protein
MLAGVVPVCAAAQLPHSGDIEFYGLRRIAAERILGAIGIAPGGTVPACKGELENRIAGIPGVVAAQVAAACCDGDRVDVHRDRGTAAKHSRSTRRLRARPRCRWSLSTRTAGSSARNCGRR